MLLVGFAEALHTFSLWRRDKTQKGREGEDLEKLNKQLLG